MKVRSSVPLQPLGRGGKAAARGRVVKTG